MSDNDANIEVEASASGIKLGATGGGAARLSGALADVLSPFSESMGFLGDRMTDLRRAAAYRAAKKSAEMLAADGITSGNVPPKILLPWLEGASVETESDGDTLKNAWAGLLARAVKSSDAVVVSYIEVLKKLGSKEAELLSFFATDTSPFFSEKFYDPRYEGGLSGPWYGDAIKNLDNISEIDPLMETMETLGFQSMCQVVYFSIGKSAVFTTKYYDDNEHAIANLEHLGLIRFRDRTFKSARTYNIVWFEITKFAFDLFWACQGELTGKASRPDELKGKVFA